MFDIGFSELVLIGVVALIVIGPERLPKVARTAGAWLGRLNRYASQVKQDIERDIKLEELRKMQGEMRDTAQKYEIMADEAGQEIGKEVGQVERTLAAMSVTDGGLGRQAFDELQAEAASPDAPQGAGVPGTQEEGGESAATPSHRPAEAGLPPA